MREEFEKLAAAGKIEGTPRRTADKLARAAAACTAAGASEKSRRWTRFSRASRLIFPGKPGHTMDLAFAAESLKPIPKDHILARKAADLEAVARWPRIISI
jgi:hypothetical protein